MKTTKNQYVFYVYILTDQFDKVLYIGVTNNIKRRVWEHKNKINKGFTSKHNLNKLVYYETFQWIQNAIKREKVLKKYLRQKKIELIESQNPNWEEIIV